MIYLDNAATTGKKPYQVAEAIMEELYESANPGRASHKLSLKSFNKIYETRESLAKLFKVDTPENFILTPNATYALNFAIKGILRNNDHVITTSMEHNSVLRPLYSINNISISTVRGNNFGLIEPTDIKNEIRPSTALIIINHSSNVNGIVQNIEEISKIAASYGIPLLIDASQTAGIIDIDGSKFDMIAFPGHKSLYGPQGTGGLYVSGRIKLKTIIEGGTGSNSKSRFNPLDLPDRLESGTLNTPGFCGLNAGIDFVLSEGIDSIRNYEHSLLKMLLNELYNMEGIKVYTPNNTELISNSIAFNINNLDSTEVAGQLDEKYGICVRPGFHCAYPAHLTLGSEKQGSIRISVSYFNNREEIIKTIDSIYKISKD